MPASYITGQSNTGTLTITQAAGGAQTTWNLTSLSVSFAGPSRGPNARLSVYDGTVAGTLIFRLFLDQPTGSVGFSQNITDLLPRDQHRNVGLQATPGNAMTIVIDGFGANIASANGRVLDGLP